jgi:hypothetical protein
MKKDLVCQEAFDHRIWSAVSVIIIRRNVECFLRPLNCRLREVLYRPLIPASRDPFMIICIFLKILFWRYISSN